ncbi:MAG: phosphatidylglycerol lysyltransferase domain-containing protein [Clostridium sp.]|nr:phosphatidylglycerol lysyltransferase domain-containing protein [Clostridium sp.]MCM1399729.1 phosphatidylglycerol lysyltransferase domain-containing protein [Clostridium sp.]MCM1460436.1 phosphatidylglycerol lysyltransferase domain-containing protein [Bacteroides sp.]
MTVFRATRKDKPVLEKYLRYNHYPGCEFSAANNILWSPYYDTGYVVIEDMLSFCKLKNEIPVCFSFPVGNGDAKKAFDCICEYFDENNMEFSMYLVEENMFAQIEKWYPDKYQISFDRDSADYLYEYKTLAELKGKKLHGKRNHINAFTEQYPNYVYEDIDEANVNACKQLTDDWAREHASVETDGENFEYEVKVLKFALDNMKELGLEGGLIRVDERVVAFTVGEPLTKDTYVIHFEKAYADVRGAYPMINREYVRRRLSGYRYINREEDMGIPGLRHAKTSYQPVRLVEKGFVTRRKS